MSLITAPAIKCFRFTLSLAGKNEMTDELQGRILAAGCDDASLWSEGGQVFLGFDRNAESLGMAIGSAVQDVERAGCVVARVEVDRH